MTNSDQPNNTTETTNAEQQSQEDGKLIQVELIRTENDDLLPTYMEIVAHLCIENPARQIHTVPLIFSKASGRAFIRRLEKNDDFIVGQRFAPAIDRLLRPQYKAELEACLAEIEASDLPEDETRFDKLSETTRAPTADILKTILEVYRSISISFVGTNQGIPAHFSMKLADEDEDGDALHFYSREAAREDIAKQRDEHGFISEEQAAFFLAAITPNGDAYPNIPEEKTVYDDLVAIRKIEHPRIRHENAKASAITAIQNAHAGMAANPRWTGCHSCGHYHCGIHFEVYDVRLFTVIDIETAENVMSFLGSTLINEEQREALFGQLCSIKAELADDAENNSDDEEDDDLDEDTEKAWNGEGSNPVDDDDSDEEDSGNADSLHPAVQPDEINEDPNDDDDAEDDPKGEIESDNEEQLEEDPAKKDGEQNEGSDKDGEGANEDGQSDESGEHDDQPDTDEASPEPDDDHVDPNQNPGETTPEPEDVDNATPSNPESSPVTPVPPTLRPEQSAPAPQEEEPKQPIDDEQTEEPVSSPEPTEPVVSGVTSDQAPSLMDQTGTDDARADQA